MEVGNVPELDVELGTVENTVAVSVILDIDRDRDPLGKLLVADAAPLIPVEVFCTENVVNGPAGQVAPRLHTKLPLLSQGIAYVQLSGVAVKAIDYELVTAGLLVWGWGG